MGTRATGECFHCFYEFSQTLTSVSIKEGDTGVCGIAVLNHFPCDISGILISNCGIVVFSGPAGCTFLAFWAVFKSCCVFQAFSTF